MIRDIFTLMRAIFPLLIQFLILALDYTLDAVDTADKGEAKVNISELYDEILSKQKSLVDRLTAFEASAPPTRRDGADFKALYRDIVEFHSSDSYRLQPELEKESEVAKS
jgi:hypothetical protein